MQYDIKVTISFKHINSTIHYYNLLSLLYVRI